MKKVHVTFILFLSFVFYLCSESSITENDFEKGLNFFFLKDSTITAHQIFNENLNKLKLSDTPFYSYKDISYYNWSEHTFNVDTNKALIVHKKCINNISVFGIPFVVTVDKERIYLGAFWFAHSSLSPLVPHINASFIEYAKVSGKVIINKAWGNDETDQRNDLRIYYTLKNHGLLIE